MLVKIQKWINSLAVKIPKVFDGDIKISENSSVCSNVLDGSVNIKPVEDCYTHKLGDLVVKINEANIHREYDTGKPAGKEIW